MRLEQLEYLTAVTRHRSLRRAGEQLHVSQPALSEAIRKLEIELGLTLLDRHRSGARISDAGRDLLPHVSDVLEAADRLRAAAGRQSSQQRTTRLGTVNTGTAHVLLPALSALQSQLPDASVEVRHLPQSDIQQGLGDGTLDLGLVNLLAGDDVHPDLVGIELTRGRSAVVLPAGHALAGSAALTVEQMRAHSFIGMREGYLMHRVAHRIFGDRPPAAWHTTDGADTAKMMVASGLGLTLLPDYSLTGDLGHLSGLITSRPLADDSTTIRMVLLHRRGARTPVAVRALVSHLRRRAGRMDPPDAAA